MTLVVVVIVEVVVTLVVVVTLAVMGVVAGEMVVVMTVTVMVASLYSGPEKIIIEVFLEDHRRRTGRLQSRKEYHRADLQPTNPL